MSLGATVAPGYLPGVIGPDLLQATDIPGIDLLERRVSRPAGVATIEWPLLRPCQR